MAPKTFTVCGISGAGKTAYGIKLVEEKLRSGLSWQQIGYSSFSRAACAEAARRASDVCGEDASRLQRYGSFATLHSLALRAIGIDKKSIIDPDSSDGKSFINSACGAVPDVRQKGTLSELIGKALALWDIHRATLGHDFGLISRIIPDDSGWVTGVITSVITDKSVVANGLRRENKEVKPDGTGPEFGLASSANPVFCSAKPLFSDLVSPIWTFEKENIARAKFSVDDEKLNPSGIKSENSYRIQETLVTDRPVRSGEKSGVFGGELHNNIHSMGLRESRPSGFTADEQVRTVIEAYERNKRMYGRSDFTDILLLFLGVTVDENLNLVRTYTSGAAPNEVKAWVIDEAQDLSLILACVACKLSGDAEIRYLLGDPYQSVYGFSGSSGAVMRSCDSLAKKNGTNTLLNVSHRNCIEVIEWGEQILSEDESYESRQPQSEAWEDGEVGVFREGSVGLVKWEDFLSYTPKLACSDVMVLSRAWFSLMPVKDRLDSLGIPWRSCQEKQSSRWECPAKIAYTVCMRSLAAGEQISEQDWRRITDTLPQKVDGKELFVRGTKSKWAKIACSNKPALTIAELSQWGATFDFFEFVMDGLWRREMFLLLDNAISQFGIEIVRNPRIRLGSVHSVKGLEARNVFCLSASTERCSGADADVQEEICLKYVAVTRASKNYRLVVNVNDIARGRSQFWAAPKGFWEFDPLPPKDHYSEPRRKQDEDGSQDSDFDSQVDDFEFRI